MNELLIRIVALTVGFITVIAVSGTVLLAMSEKEVPTVLVLVITNGITYLVGLATNAQPPPAPPPTATGT